MAPTRSRRPPSPPAPTRQRSRSTRRGTRTTARVASRAGRTSRSRSRADNAKVTFSYVAATHVLTILAGHGHDNNVEWDGLRHDSRSDVYRTPGGAVEAGHPGHAPVPDVPWRRDGRPRPLLQPPAERPADRPDVAAATDVSCYQAGLESETCDYWQLTLPRRSRASPTTSGIASSSATGPTPTSTPTTRPRSMAGSAPRPTTPSTRAGRSCSTCPASRRPTGRRTRSSTRSSPTDSATAAPTTTPRPATSATTTRSCA